VLAVELRPEESRCPLQDLVGPTKLTDLLLKRFHPCCFVGRYARPVAVIDVGLVDPQPQRLGALAELARDPFLLKVHVARIEDLEGVLDQSLLYGQTTSSFIVSSPLSNLGRSFPRSGVSGVGAGPRRSSRPPSI